MLSKKWTHVTLLTRLKEISLTYLGGKLCPTKKWLLLMAMPQIWDSSQKPNLPKKLKPFQTLRVVVILHDHRAPPHPHKLYI
jgi:hypothetical protein